MSQMTLVFHSLIRNYMENASSGLVQRKVLECTICVKVQQGKYLLPLTIGISPRLSNYRGGFPLDKAVVNGVKTLRIF